MADKYLGYKENSYSAFPSGMRGQWCELNIPHVDAIAIFNIRAKLLDKVRNEDEADPYGWKEKMRILENTTSVWVYKLEYFKVNRGDINYNYEWNVADYAYDCKEFYFNTFKDFVDFVTERWAVSLSDFKRESEISVPLG